MMRRGMTFLELMIIIVILAITAAMVLPLFIEQESVTATATARLLSSDLEHAQALALSRPEQRIALAVDADGGGWRIIDADAPMSAIVDTYDGAHAGRELAVRLGEGCAAISDGGRIAPTGRGVGFDPRGGLSLARGDADKLTGQAGGRQRGQQRDKYAAPL